MNTRAFKQELLNKLYEPYKKCQECPLGSLGRVNVVFGSGNPDARLLFIGEGPGIEEDRQGKPFVGRSGKLLDQLFEAVGIVRSEVFITNIVKCRPPNNRKPMPIEINTCTQLLLFKQLQIIRPNVICTLGATALEGLLGQPVKITHQRGSVIQFKTIPVLPTYHPAYILRNPKQLQILAHDLAQAHQLSLKTYPPSGG